jgi:hypothetical protein
LNFKFTQAAGNLKLTRKLDLEIVAAMMIMITDDASASDGPGYGSGPT